MAHLFTLRYYSARAGVPALATLGHAKAWPLRLRLSRYRRDCGLDRNRNGSFLDGHLGENGMLIKIAVFAAYFLVVLVIGIVARTRWKSTPESYFLADRKLGTLVLLGTMVATNFSAFTVFGASGAGYRDGYAFFPIMGFGTGFMAITFWIIGRRIWYIGRNCGVVTPPELIRHLYGSRALSFIFALVMVVFTIPDWPASSARTNRMRTSPRPYPPSSPGSRRNAARPAPARKNGNTENNPLGIRSMLWATTMRVRPASCQRPSKAGPFPCARESAGRSRDTGGAGHRNRRAA